MPWITPSFVSVASAMVILPSGALPTTRGRGHRIPAAPRFRGRADRVFWPPALMLLTVALFAVADREEAERIGEAARPRVGRRRAKHLALGIPGLRVGAECLDEPRALAAIEHEAREQPAHGVLHADPAPSRSLVRRHRTRLVGHPPPPAHGSGGATGGTPMSETRARSPARRWADDERLTGRTGRQNPPVLVPPWCRLTSRCRRRPCRRSSRLYTA